MSTPDPSAEQRESRKPETRDTGEATELVSSGEATEFVSRVTSGERHPTTARDTGQATSLVSSGEATELVSTGAIARAAAAELSTGGATELVDSRRLSQAPDGRFGRYRLISQLGEGGMGLVLLAADDELNREVAIKLLSDAHPLLEAKFVAEAQITGQLEHPNIVPVYELGAVGGRRYISMRRIRGRTLSDWMRAEPATDRVRLHARLTVFSRICDAMRFAHSRGVIHRDLKPDNVMLGAFGEVQVMDWGLACLQGDPDSGVALGGAHAAPERTMAGSVMGTPVYMAPEQAAGDLDAIAPQTDVYALGAILYEMLTDARPLAGDSVAEILEQVKAGAVVPPAERCPERGLPWELDVVVRRAMATAPRDRYPDVEALQADVEAFLAGRTLSAARYSRFQRLGKWIGRNRVLAGSLAAALLLAGGLVAASIWHGVATARELAQRRADAHQAYLREEYANAIAAARGALDLAPDDADMIETERRARAALAAERQAAGRDARFRELRRQLLPLEGQVQRVRLLSYVPAAAVASERARLREEVIPELRRLATGADYGGFAEVWLLLAEAHEAVEEPLSSLAAALEAAGRASASQGPLVATRLGRLHLQRALFCWRMGDLPAAERALERARALRLRGDQHGKLAAAIAVYLEGAEVSTVREMVLPLVSPGAFEPGSEILLWLLAHMDSERGLDWMRSAVRLCPHGARGWFLCGASAQRAGQTAEAVRAYERALLLQPALQVARVNLGTARHELGDVDGARRALRRALVGRDGYAMLQPSWLGVSASLMLARLEMREGDIPAASAALARGLELAPDEPALLMAEGLVALERGDTALAEARMRPPRKDDRREAVDVRARLASALGNGELALAEARRLAARTKRRPGPYRLLAQMELIHGDPRRALAAIKKAIESGPTSVSSWSIRAQIEFQARDLAGCEASYSRILQLAPGDTNAQLGRAIARRARGALPEALRDLDQVLAARPDWALALSHRGLVRAMIGDDLPGALADVTRAAGKDPEATVVRLNRGLVRYRIGKLEPALADFEFVLARDPREPDAVRGAAYTLRSLKRADEALALLDRFLEHQEDAGAFTLRGSMRLEAGSREDAVADFGRSLALRPRDLGTHLLRGRALFLLRRYAPAVADLDVVLAAKPDHLQARVMRGYCNDKLGRHAGVVEDIGRVVVQLPANDKFAYMLAKALLRLRRLDEARAACVRAIKHVPADKRAKFRKLIEQIDR